jgi:uracil-DNA glycosylase
MAAGQSPHQRRVRQIAEMLGLNIRDVFATNAVFLRSIVAEHIPIPELFDECWPVHQRFLSIVKPSLVLCLGNGDGSSFCLLRTKAIALPPVTEIGAGFRDGRFYDATFRVNDGTTLGCRVLGLPHPSRFVLSAALRSFAMLALTNATAHR